jgi:hypothetical protein
MTSNVAGSLAPQLDLSRPADRGAILRLLCASVILGLLAYGALVVTVVPAIDVELAGFDDNLAPWVARSRWTTWLLRVLLIPDPVMSVVPMGLAILGLAGSWVVTAVTWRWPIGRAHYLAAPFAICCPVLIHLLIFLDISFAVGIGCLLASLGVWCLAEARPTRRLLAVPLLAMATGCYQPVILYGVVSGLVLAALRIPTEGWRRSLRRIVGLAAVVMLALLLNEGVARLMRWASGIELDYVDQFIQLGGLVHDPGAILGRTVRFAWSMLSGTADLYVEKGRLLAVTLLLAAIVALAGALRACRAAGDVVLIAAAVAGFVIGPLLVPALSRGVFSYRHLLGVPVAFAGLVFMAAATEAPRLVRSLLAVLCAVCLLGFVNTANRLIYQQTLVAAADRDLATRIMERAALLGFSGGARPIRAEFAGAHGMLPWPYLSRVGSSTLGASFFEWGGGNPWRIAAFMRSLGFAVTIVAPAERAALRARIESMPSWPDRGAVQDIDGVLVVKLSDYTPMQRQRYGLAP